MKFFLLVVGLLIALTSSSAEDNFIVGGSDASIRDYPYMAGILNFGITTCGGSIISSRSVLTAAHCIPIIPIATVSIFVGSSRRRGQGGRTHRVIRVTIHPDYNLTTEPAFRIGADIAIIRTLTEIRFGRFVQPIPLGINPVTLGSTVRLTGWGLMGDSIISDRADRMQKLDMITIPNLLCEVLNRGTGTEGAMSAEMICTVASENRGGCGGDSGGPITLNGAVVGVVSWGARPCGSFPTVFIRVAHHAEWIQKNM